jgi:hypothetical protein
MPTFGDIIAVIVGMIRRRMRGLRSNPITPTYPMPKPAAAPPIDPNDSLTPYAVDAQTPIKAPNNRPRIGNRYKMAAPVKRPDDDK